MNGSLLRVAIAVAVALLAATAGHAAPVYCDQQCSGSSCRTDYCTHPESGQIITCQQWGTYDTGDYDCDGIANGPDNCYSVANSNQADCDNDGQGDVCDSDNGIFVRYYAWHCYINGTNYGAFSKIRSWWEGRYRDTSACNSPDKFTTTYVGSHTCWFTGASSCCDQVYGSFTCDQYYDNDQCP